MRDLEGIAGLLALIDDLSDGRLLCGPGQVTAPRGGPRLPELGEQEQVGVGHEETLGDGR